MLKKLTPTLLVASILVGCAKEKAYEEVYKEPEQLPKSEFKLTETVEQKIVGLNGEETTVKKEVPVKYLYVPMTMGTPREVVGAKPFYQGDEKVVRLEWSKDGLEVIQIEKDERFNDNTLNELPVLTIPGVFAKYQCAEDSFGDCTNKEEEDTEITWDQKDYFTPDYAGIKVKEVNMLDLVNVEADGCASLQGTKVVDYEVSDGVINVELEKTYKLANSWRCIRDNYFDDKLDYNSFKVRYFYSMVELKQLATPGYEPIAYPIPDHDEFGFFKNEELVLSDNYDSQRKERKILMNRWAPNRDNNELVYYLSANYTKPENKALLDATHNAANIINKGFAKGNVPFRLKIVEQEYGKEEVSPGDLRYNTIVLIEDPLANGLLGYGPSVSNPYTGEIVQAHTNMYGGVLTSTVRRTYQAAVDLSIERNQKVMAAVTDITVAPSAITNLPATLVNNIANAVEVPTAPAGDEPASNPAASTSLASAEVAVDTMIRDLNIQLEEVSLANLDSIDEAKIEKMMEHRMNKMVNLRMNALATEDENQKGFNELQRRTFKALDDKHGRLKQKHVVEEFPIAGTTKVIYPEIFKVPGIKNTDGTLKNWDQLNSFQKKKIKEIILVESYTSTLIHEIGHNLGLRHNFSGSTDKDNFFTEAEAQELGMSKPAAYSSIMDYAFSEYNELKSLGKYDIAALRFAYAREVELSNGQIVPVRGTLESFDQKLKEDFDLTRKAYSFCTDENAGLSSMCNRFDEGTTLTEIAKYRIKRYKDAYKYRNFRDGKLDFSSYNMSGYVVWRYRELAQIRDIIEEYEFFAGIFGAELMNQGCGPADLAKYPICQRINDYRDAVRLVGDFFVELVKTPDHICAVVDKKTPNVIVEYKKLIEIYDEIKYDIKHVPTSCFDKAVANFVEEESEGARKIIGENGKFFNGFKDTNPNYKYSSDRAVLGIWVDKVFAMNNLFSRRWRNRTSDTNHMALMDIPYIQDKVLPLLAHLTMGEPMKDPLPFKMEDGAQFTAPYVIGNDYKIEQLEDAFFWIKLHFGMDFSGVTNFTEVLLGQIYDVGVNYGEDNSAAAFEMANLVAINRVRGYERNQLPNQPHFFDGINMTYYGNIATPVANLMLNAIVEKEYLDEQDKGKLIDVFMRRTNPEAPAELSENHKAFFKQPKGLHDQLISLAQQGVPLSVEVFVNAIGEEDGPKVHAVYEEGFVVMQSIITLKTQIMTTPANPAEVKLFNLPIELLAQYLNGQLTDELIQYYQGQIRRLPNFQDMAIR